MKAESSLVKVESSVVLQGNQSLALTNKNLPSYYPDLRNWWNDLGIDWKHDFINAIDLDENIDDHGNILKEPTNYELVKIILSKHLMISRDHESLYPLHKLCNLETLEGRSNRRLKSIQGLENLTNLKKIVLKFTGIHEIKPLERLKQLEILDLGDLIFEINFDPLRSLCNLEYLNIHKIPGLTPARVNLSPIENLQNLKNLDCGGYYIESLEFLEKLVKLEVLNISFSHINNLKFDIIFNLKNLIALSISKTNIIDIPMVILPKLEYLNINYTSVPEFQIKKFSQLNPNCEIVIKFNEDSTYVFCKDSKIKNDFLRGW